MWSVDGDLDWCDVFLVPLSNSPLESSSWSEHGVSWTLRRIGLAGVLNECIVLGGGIEIWDVFLGTEYLSMVALALG